MIGAVLLLLLPAFIEGCGNRPAGARVVNGQNAAPHSWPWQISLRKNGYHICGGTLIRPDWVVTAAHCVYRNPNPSAYTVVVGAHRRLGISSVERHFRLARVIKHAGFTMENLKHDIALLQLKQPATLSSKVNVACLPTRDAAIGAKCYITGWGRLSGVGASADTLQQAVLPVVSQEDCKKKYNRVEPKPHLCAGEAQSSASGGCNGDSGGPLVCQENGRWVLHGAVSFGKENCPTTHYTVFSRVHSYLDWINSNMGNVLPPPPTPPAPATPPIPTTGSPPPSPPIPGDCKDSWSPRSCSFYKKNCSRPFVQNACRKTCNLC